MVERWVWIANVSLALVCSTTTRGPYRSCPGAFLIEPCADVIVSAARRSILVGGGAPPFKKIRGVGGPKFFLLSSNLSDDLFLVSQKKIQQNN